VPGTVGPSSGRRPAPARTANRRPGVTHGVLALQRRAGNGAVVAALAGRWAPRASTSSAVATVQRDLLAYSEPTIRNTATGSMRSSADGRRILEALSVLVAAGKVTMTSAGKEYTFSAWGATTAEISAALAHAGFERAPEMAAALLDTHNVTVYSGEATRKTKFTKTTSKAKLERQENRKLTPGEVTEARRVFGSALNLDAVTVHEGGIATVGGYARTIYNKIYFPKGTFSSGDFMPYLIHELTHVWQYQQGAEIQGMIFEALVGNYDYGGEAGLKKAWDDGQAFDEFSIEQQGDILEDYYKRLRATLDVTAYKGFVEQVRTGRAKEHRYKTVTPLEGGTLDVGASYERHRAKTEAAIVEQLKLRIRPGDRAATAARFERVLALFDELLPYWSERYRDRVRMRSSQDELVTLLYSRLSRDGRAKIFAMIGGL
jgi:hypothetical protein